MVTSPHSQDFVASMVSYHCRCVIKLIVSTWVVMNSVNVSVASYVMVVMAEKGDENKL